MWQPDILGDDYLQQVLELGPDPDGEGDVRAVVVRHSPSDAPAVRAAVLYVHGFSDYFFQTALARFFAARGHAFFAVDLRKSGRARREGQTAHHVSDLRRYDEELDRTLDLIAEAHPGVPVVVVAHSTGGLITPLWLERRRRAGRTAPVARLVLNSPWFDLQGASWQREIATPLFRPLSRVRPMLRIVNPIGPYTRTLHVDHHGEWDFDLALKPLDGFPVTVSWLNAIRRGQAELHRGLDVGVPSLVLRSEETYWSREYDARADRADGVLDVKQIARWAGCLGNEVTVVPIPGARHDVFLSQADARERAYATLDRWLEAHPYADTPS